MSLNIKKNSCEIIVKKGSLLSEWRDQKFEIIVCDVSSISDEVARISPWFDSVNCDTGSGGDKLIKEVIENISKHGQKNCKFYFPIISLSDVEVKSYPLFSYSSLNSK